MAQMKLSTSIRVSSERNFVAKYCIANIKQRRRTLTLRLVNHPWMAKAVTGGQNGVLILGNLIANTLPIGRNKQKIRITFLKTIIRAVIKMEALHVALDNGKKQIDDYQPTYSMQSNIPSLNSSRKKINAAPGGSRMRGGLVGIAHQIVAKC
mmetsp:Transcript_6962/g.11669  ORF Transcript_6962/g.11669 Transcript_6962/m.11669 type:complete len:152 (+) Transcript_6962:634-1089(+)